MLKHCLMKDCYYCVEELYDKVVKALHDEVTGQCGAELKHYI